MIERPCEQESAEPERSELIPVLESQAEGARVVHDKPSAGERETPEEERLRPHSMQRREMARWVSREGRN